jgi:hypothetical protein
MKLVSLGVALLVALSGMTGCSIIDGGCAGGDCGQGGGCQTCGDTHPQMRALRQHMQGDNAISDVGPPTAAITYPYYTTHGPRDFFAASPPSIGR